MIKVENLTKNFDGYLALNNFSMNVKKGSIYGLVGVNGAGKTTVIKHLAGIIKGDSGSVVICDAAVYDNISVKSRVGYVSDDLYFFPQYNLKMLSKFYGKLHKNWSNEKFTNLLNLLGLDNKRRVGRFSKGMQKQAALALALSANPDVLLLDEPIDGLDPIVRKRIFEWIIDDVASRQMTVLISSHNLAEIQKIVDRVVWIDNGKIVGISNIDDIEDIEEDFLKLTNN